MKSQIAAAWFRRSFPFVQALGLGITAGISLFAAVLPLTLEFGGVVTLTASLFVAGAIAWGLANWWSNRVSWRSLDAVAAVLFALVWTMLAPIVLNAVRPALGRLPLEVLGQTWVQLVWTIFVCMLTAGPVLLAMFVVLRAFRNGRRFQAPCALVGVILALLVIPSLLLPATGLFALFGIALLLAVVVGGLSWNLPGAISPVAHGDFGEIAPVPALFAVRPLTALIGGGLLAVVATFSMQLLGQQLAILCAMVAGLTLGVAAAAGFRKGQIQHVGWISLMLAAWVGFLTASYSFWIWLSLTATSWTWLPGGGETVRWTLVVLMTAPFGWCLSQLVRNEGSGSLLSSRLSAVMPLLGAVGFLAAQLVNASPAGTCFALLMTSVALSLIALSRQRFASCQGRTRIAMASGCAVLALGGALTTGGLWSVTGDELMFTPQAWQGALRSMRLAEIPWADDSRPVAQFQTMTGRWTLTKHRGVQLVARRDGVATELRSYDPGVCPQSFADVLPTLYSLTLHEDAEHVLILGMHAPSLEVCHAWPLMSVTVMDGDAGASQFLQALQSGRHGPFPELDPATYRTVGAPPVLGLQAQDDRLYDVIVSARLQMREHDAATQFTSEFYSSAADKLAPDGLYCQRLVYHEAGAELLRQIVATARSAFPCVQIVESVPGELLLIGTREEREFVRSDLVERLKSPQCRRVLAEAGCDWSMMLGRGMLPSEAIGKLLADGKRRDPMTLRNGVAAWRIASELRRKGFKLDETRRLLARHAQGMLTRLGDLPEVNEVANRLEDLRLALEIQSEHPDDPWRYRDALRTRLKERPRAEILPVKHEGLKRVLHPEDEQRKKYLVALGEAIRHENEESANGLLKFESPFDPLVSIFLHYELANLHQKRTAVTTEERARCLLHTVYFAASNDQSVRNVSDAMTALCALETDAQADRWDDLNGLLQILSLRWSLRMQEKRNSRYEVIDAEKSIAAAEQALAVMEGSLVEAGLTAQEWESRKVVLEKTLLQPLRQLRSEKLRQASLGP